MQHIYKLVAGLIEDDRRSFLNKKLYKRTSSRRNYILTRLINIESGIV